MPLEPSAMKGAETAGATPSDAKDVADFVMPCDHCGIARHGLVRPDP